MDGFILEFKEMKESIKRLEAENNEVKDSLSKLEAQNNNLNDTVGEIKNENVVLRELVEALVEDRDDSALLEQKRVGKICRKLSRVEKTVKNLKEETSKKTEELSCRISLLHRVFNSLHASLQSRKELLEGEGRIECKIFDALHVVLQSRKELEGEIRDVKDEVTEVKKSLQSQSGASSSPVNADVTDAALARFNPQAIPPIKPSRHPSKKGSYRDGYFTITENQKERMKSFTFRVYLDILGLYSDPGVCIQGYTKVETPNEYMDPESGLYTVPMDGDYQFDFTTSSTIRTADGVVKAHLYLCTDQSSGTSAGKCRYLFSNQCASMCLSCKAGDLVWLESALYYENGGFAIQDVVFKGKLLP